MNVGFEASLIRAAESVPPLVEYLDENLRLHRVQETIRMLLYALALQPRLTDATDPPIPIPQFTTNLLDAVEGMLRA